MFVRTSDLARGYKRFFIYHSVTKPGRGHTNRITVAKSRKVLAGSPEEEELRREMERKRDELQKRLDESASREEFFSSLGLNLERGRGRPRQGDSNPLSGLVLSRAEHYGLPLVVGKLLEDMGLDRLTSGRAGNQPDRHLKTLVWSRLASWGISKRGFSKLLELDYGIALHRNSMYQAMDKLDGKAIERLQVKVAKANRKLLGEGGLSLMLYDTTSLYFEAVREDDQRRYGMSKDGKGRRVQMILGLWQCPDGLPLGYQLFPGNSADVSTLLPALARVGKLWGAGKVVVVADNGILSKQNLAALVRAGHDYIISSSPRKMAGAVKEQLLGFDYRDGKAVFRTQLPAEETPGGTLPTRSYWVDFSDDRARRDLHFHEKNLKRARAAVGDNGKVLKAVATNPTVRKFLKSRGYTALDETAIKDDVQFFGLWGLVTSLDWRHHEVKKAYHELHCIEHSFRDLKHTLGVRPTFHYTLDRIKAHFALCYLGFAAIRRLRYLLKKAYPDHDPILTTETLVEELRRIRRYQVENAAEEQRGAVGFRLSDLQEKILKLLDLEPKDRGIMN